MTELVERCILKCSTKESAARFATADGVVLVISNFVFIFGTRAKITALVEEHKDAVVAVTFEPRAQAVIRTALGGNDAWLPTKANNNE